MQIFDFHSISQKNADLRAELLDKNSTLEAFVDGGADAIQMDGTAFDQDGDAELAYAEKQMGLLQDDFCHAANVTYLLLFLTRLQEVSLNKRADTFESSGHAADRASLIEITEEIGKTQAFGSAMKQRLSISSQALEHAGIDAPDEMGPARPFVIDHLEDVTPDMDPQLWAELQTEALEKLCGELHALAETQMEVVDADLAYALHAHSTDQAHTAGLPSGHAQNLLDQAGDYLNFSSEYLQTLQNSLGQDQTREADGPPIQ